MAGRPAVSGNTDWLLIMATAVDVSPAHTCFYTNITIKIATHLRIASRCKRKSDPAVRGHSFGSAVNELLVVDLDIAST